MKKAFCAFLAVVLLLALCIPAAAFASVRSNQALSVNGVVRACDKYNIDGSNYFKLRDLAQLLNGTGSQFDVGWDAENGVVSITTGHAYTTPNGHELEIGEDQSATTQVSAQTILINGTVRGDLTVYNIGGSNFFKLRELGEALGFVVDYDAASNTALVFSGDGVAYGPGGIRIGRPNASASLDSDIFVMASVLPGAQGKKFSYEDAVQIYQTMSGAMAAINSTSVRLSGLLTDLSNKDACLAEVRTAVSGVLPGARALVSLFEQRIPLTYSDGSTVLQRAQKVVDVLESIEAGLNSTGMLAMVVGFDPQVVMYSAKAAVASSQVEYIGLELAADRIPGAREGTETGAPNAEASLDSDIFVMASVPSGAPGQKFSYEEAVKIYQTMSAAMVTINESSLALLNCLADAANRSAYLAEVKETVGGVKSQVQALETLFAGRIALTYTDGSTVLQRAQKVVGLLESIETGLSGGSGMIALALGFDPQVAMHFAKAAVACSQVEYIGLELAADRIPDARQ